MDVKQRKYIGGIMEDVSGVNKDMLAEALVESNELLQEENSRLRNNNRMLRAVVSALRGVNSKLRTSVEIAQQNDEIFKSFCQGDFDAPVSISAEVGLADAVNTVEPVV